MHKSSTNYYRCTHIFSGRILICLALILSTAFATAQDSVSDETLADSQKATAPITPNAHKTVQGIQYDSSFLDARLRKKDQNLILFGYYRLFLYGRNIPEAYPNLAPYQRAYGVGDGYREPMLSVTVLGRPSGKSSFGTELFFFTPYLGSGPADNVFTMNLGLNFYGNFRTRHGNFGVRAGGIHWYNLSSFTIGVYQILDRYSIFDRTPWEGVNHTEKYDSYYETGATSPGDLRWNNQAFQGLIINGAKLPGDFSFDLFWGKTQPNGGLSGAITEPATSIPATLDAGSVPNYLGFNGTSRIIPNFIYGGKLGRTFGRKRHSLSYNLLISQTAQDSLLVQDSTLAFADLRRPYRNYQVHSLAYDLHLWKIRLKGELAMGSYESPTYDKKWGEALMARIYVPEEYTWLPLDIQLYQISKNFFNQNGEIATNSNREILEDQGLIAGANGFGGQIAQVNQLVHNRRGININTGIEIERFKFNVGWGLSAEIDPEATMISYVHRINGLALSRVYNPFPANATGPTIFGPYGRKISFFRGVSEVAQTTDLDAGTAEALNRKYFSSVDLQAKFRTSFLDHPLYFFYLGSLGSASASLEAIPLLSDNGYLFVQYHEFDLYYELFPKFLLTMYYGLENVRGGQFTDWDLTSQLPRDQQGVGVGIGFDWTVAENVGIYFRHRWMSFEDRSFTLDTYKGREVTIELKTFF
ncbi:MAG: hypothetical protein GYB31_00195 [Bacteroidetes bacterium]|nr:hypothetical protein [Bacteroidota bacterium]